MARAKTYVISKEDRAKLASVDSTGASTNPDRTNWVDVEVNTEWYEKTARYVGDKVGIHNKWVRDFLAEPYMDQVTQNLVNKAWRAMLLTKQVTARPADTANKKIDPARDNGNILTKETKYNNKVSNKGGTISRNGYSSVLKQLSFNGTNDSLSLHSDVEYNEAQYNKAVEFNRSNNNQVIIYNTSISPYEYIVLQTRPPQVDFKGETSWAAVKSMGRNTPIYQYTGAEDTIQFNISWYCTDKTNLPEVISKCRLLESWSKANGYLAAPPILQLQWGESNLFANHDLILISATYSLTNFSNGVRVSISQFENHKLYPLAATQELIFKRVSSTNLTHQDILQDELKNKIVQKQTTT